MTTTVPYLRLLPGGAPCSPPGVPRRAPAEAPDDPPPEPAAPAALHDQNPIDTTLLVLGSKLLGRVDAYTTAMDLERKAKRRERQIAEERTETYRLIATLCIVVGAVAICLYALHLGKDPLVADVLKIALGALGGFGFGSTMSRRRKK